MQISTKHIMASLSNSELDALKNKKEDTAMEFEKIFARHLVSELTKGSFDMVQEGGLTQSNALYREHITETLASELAQQKKLGMADLIMQYWSQRLGDQTESE